MLPYSPWLLLQLAALAAAAALLGASCQRESWFDVRFWLAAAALALLLYGAAPAEP